MNNIYAQPNQNLQLPTDQLSLLTTEVMGLALQRLGQPQGWQNGNCSHGPDQLDVDMNPASNGLPNFSSWLTPQSPAAPQAPAAPLQNGGKAQGNEGSWTQEDEAALDRAVSGGAEQNGGGFDHIFQQFGQSQEGNCASVAVIKAAMDKYQGHVFQQVTRSNEGYRVSLQDGKQVSISKGELKAAAKAADFKGKPNEAKSLAVLMFAVMAKRAQQEGLAGSFDQALKKLDHGFDPRKAAELAGLGQKIRNINPNSVKGQDAVVAWSPQHAVYIDSNGTDSYGQARATDGTDTRGHNLQQAFTFA